MIFSSSLSIAPSFILGLMSELRSPATRNMLLRTTGCLFLSTALHYLVCLYSLYHYRVPLAYAHSVTDSFYQMTLRYPAFLCPTWPIPSTEFAVYLLPQSFCFGLLFTVLFISIVSFMEGRNSYLFHAARLLLAAFTLAVALYLLTPLMLIFTLFVSPGNTLEVSSNALPPHTNKQTWLSDHLSPPAPTPILASEFHFRINCGGLGPSSDYSIVAVKVAREDIGKWLTMPQYGLQRETAITAAAIHDPLPLNGWEWHHTSSAGVLQRR